jgi:phage-related tail protein
MGLGMHPELAGVLGANNQQTSIVPKTDDSIDLGSSTKEFKDGFFDGTVRADAFTADGNLTFSTTGIGVVNSVGAALTAAGTTITDALQLAAVLNNVSTAGAGTGVKLWNPTIGVSIFVRNGGANDLLVYPANASGTINGGSAGAAITLAASGNGCAWFHYLAANTWVGPESNSAA